MGIPSTRITWTRACPASRQPCTFSWAWTAIPQCKGVRVCCGIPVIIARCRKEFWSCGAWSGRSGDLDVLNACLRWQGLGLDDSGGPWKTCVPKCVCWGKRAKMRMLVYTAAESDGCQLKLQSCKCLCVEIYVAAMLFGIFFWLFVQTYEEKKKTLLKTAYIYLV